MKEILCFGDSNTYGLIPKTNGRYDREVRWTGLLQDALKKGHSFPAARHQALEKLTGDASVSQILSELHYLHF